jgi:predicted RNA-binding Zn ribbon-like protein
VVFAHDTELSLQAAVALANSAEGVDTLTTLDDLERYVREHEFTGSRTHDQAELDAVRALRAELWELLTGDRDTTVGLVNRMLASRKALPQLVRHEGWDWHLHATDPADPLVDRIAVEAAMAMIDVIRLDELSRLGTCAADDCEAIVLDLSRNRSRRFCSTSCGNRVAVAAYRARQA